jgi:uncharacterized membrane protein HdeD (DUF308 family)
MRFLSGLVAVIAGLFLLASPAAAADGERITSYGVTLQVRPDGSMQVEETIAYDFGGNARHGIDRELDTESVYDGSHHRRFPVSDVTASSATAPDDVAVTGGNARTTIRIGDPDRTITGPHTYRISYTVAAVTTRYADHDELYWDVVGPDWDVPIDAITVRVSGAEVTASSCFAGRPGGKDPCTSAEGGSFGQGSLAAGQVLTVVAGFPAGSVAAAAPILSDRLTVRRFLIGTPAYAVPGALLALGIPLLLLLGGLRRKKAQEAPALAYRDGFQPQPPAGVRPLLANTLLSGTFKTVDPVSVLLDLSARGYLSITPLSKRDWRLVAVRPPDGSLHPEEQEVLRAAFAKGPDTTLSGAGRALTRARGPLKRIALDGVVDQGWYTRRPGGNTGWAALGGALIVASFPLTLALGFLTHAGIVGPALFAGGIVLIAHAFTKAQPRTEAGEVARSQLLAFKRTLSGIDPGRLPPEQREATLGGLLPYAVVLGLAPQLAAAFSAAGVVAGGYAMASNPMWWSTFSTDATHATSPSSSSSGGSGFSGGSSGGGGGGGGGGSW